MKRTRSIIFDLFFLCLALQAQGNWRLLKTESIADDTIKWHQSYSYMVIVSSKEDAKNHTAWDLYFPKNESSYQRNAAFIGSECWQEARDIQKMQLMRWLTPKELQTLKHIVNTDSIQPMDELMDVRIGVNYKENWLSVISIGIPLRGEFTFNAQRIHELIQQINSKMYYPQWKRYKPQLQTGMEYVQSNVSLRKYEIKALLDFFKIKSESLSKNDVN